jgi:hypothetical protein
METKKGGLSDRNRNARLSSWLNSTTKPDWMKGHPVAVAIVTILIDKGEQMRKHRPHRKGHA